MRSVLANSQYLAKLCAGETCDKSSHPILDFDQDIILRALMQVSVI